MQRPIDPELQLFPLQIGKLVFPFVEIQEHDLVSAVIRKACPLEYPGIGFALFRIEYPGAECRCNAALMLFTLDDAMAKVVCHINDMHRPRQHQQRKGVAVAPDDQLRRHFFNVRSQIDDQSHRTVTQQLFRIGQQPVHAGAGQCRW